MPAGDFRKKQAHVPIAGEGVPYILAAMFATLIAAVLGWAIIALLLLAVTFLIGHFFRDPERISTAGEADIISPADGRVIAVTNVRSARFTDKPAMKISIFMSILDVHVNRIPVSGTIQGAYYRKGRFLAANLVQASDENEQNWLWIRSDLGADIIITQVAGLIARRIVCWPETGDRVLRGERFGMIRFGSRVDLYVPENSEIFVCQGNHVYGGETLLCRLNP
ncbi:MAG TPA: phosphatidylserine decarboxylase family protein [Syntrophobacteraceae bacterium]|nr:phosphatidylserine decarboxylase family protein [Syntrophobacteraceae bacterium]